MNCKTTALLLFVIAIVRAVASGYSDTFKLVNDTNGCSTVIHHFDPLVHKPKYRVGIFSSEGDEEVYRLYNQTFAQYLTFTAGRRFDPPIEFEIVPVTLNSLSNLAQEENIDFFFSSSAVFSCMATEYKAQALVTVINRRLARGREYELDVYGGVMFTLAGNDRVNDIDDFRGKKIGAGSITAMGGGQTQFYEMFREGLSYVADPLQVVFTLNERLTVQGVLDGDFEIGFARTDQIERHLDANGEHIDPDVFKVINPQIHILDNGELFPFVSSTGLHPEWPFAALYHVSRDVSKEAQDALLALRDHAISLELGQNLRCETTPEIAELALTASNSGALAGFRTARSYFDVRTKQEAAGFLFKHEDGEMRCIRGNSLYNDIQCPEGQYKLSYEDFQKSCETAGLMCREGYECFCKPCVEAFEVAVFQDLLHDPQNPSNYTVSAGDDGCEKMSLCGVVEQNKLINFHIVDNRQRDNVNVEITIHFNFETIQLEVEQISGNPYMYQVNWVQENTGIGVMEIFVDNEQIPQSPVRVQVIERRCDLDFPGQRRTSTADGNCDCSQGSIEIGGRCIESTIVAVTSSILAVIIVCAIVFQYVAYRNRKMDEIWKIDIDELQFDDPVEVIGQGSFGVVLLAQYRGTNIALKRALRVMKKNSKRGSKQGGSASGSKSNRRSKSSGIAASNTDSVGLSSVDTAEKFQDTELGQVSRDEGGDVFDEFASAQGVQSGGRSDPSSQNFNSLGFLAEDFGPASKWKWLFPWLKRDNYRNRFKEAILGSTGASSHGKTWHAMFCPWFDAQVRAEEDFMVEMRVLSRLRHPCVTTVLGAVVSRSHDPMPHSLSLWSMGLCTTCKLRFVLNSEIILQIARDVAQGLRFLHSSRPPILHGDMKARNILVDSRFRAKLCDFGLSIKKHNRITGTPYWLAPEYLRGQTMYTSMCDIYSVGIILYEIYAREDPYKGEDFRDTLRKICDRRVNKRPGVPTTCPPTIVDLMKKCWSPDASFRPSAKNLDTALLDMTIRDAEPLTKEEQMQGLRKERATGDMLYELFPKHVADALSAGQKVEPEQHEEVTVVFSDIVHFTDISRALTPLKVSTMLDRLYLAFDKVARKNNVFKVETIGDAYMGVTNLDNTQTSTHVKNAALFAIDLVNEASKIMIDDEDPSKGFINIRVGFHSGPVVSNVIGSLNPRYGLFGDTVNTSNRMESNSKANHILCSEASYHLLEKQAPGISVKKRGKIAVKGKGDMVVYWVGHLELKTRKGDTTMKFETGPVEFKRVEFENEEEEEEEEEKEELCEVDEHLWRRDLQSRLMHMDSADTVSKTATTQATNKLLKKPQEQGQVFDQTSSSKGSIKEAVHMFRGPDIY